MELVQRAEAPCAAVFVVSLFAQAANASAIKAATTVVDMRAVPALLSKVRILSRPPIQIALSKCALERTLVGGLVLVRLVVLVHGSCVLSVPEPAGKRLEEPRVSRHYPRSFSYASTYDRYATVAGWLINLSSSALAACCSVLAH